MHCIRWNKTLSALLIALLYCQSYAYAATIGNVKCIVTPDEKIMIYYQISGKGTYTVSVQVSLDGGKTYGIEPIALTGDVGKGVSAGVGKKIEWDVFRDVKRLSGNMVVRVEAAKERGKPINKWYVLAGIVLIGGTIAAMGGGGGGETKPSGGAPPVISYGTIYIELVFPE